MTNLNLMAGMSSQANSIASVVPFTLPNFVEKVEPEDKPNQNERGVTVGIPASTGDENITRVLETVLQENYPHGFRLTMVVVVASALEAATLTELRRLAKADNRVVLIEESERRGKWEAINRILDETRDEYLILVNGDAIPDKGSLSKLLVSLHRDNDVAIVSGFPILAGGSGIVTRVARIFWEAHNESLSRLVIAGVNNHSCDEMMALRVSLVKRLPPGTINDGAYLAGEAFREGYRVSFCSDARVRITIPRRLPDIMKQRRRIIFGHLQVWRSVGSPPKTVESTALSSPREAVSILASIIGRNPQLLAALPLAIIEELLAVSLAILDSLSKTERHTVWERYAATT
jgi:cellulose synthase/poly-beta-1,6-N-acetylglucosamine synthase-like glycosyltransferase